MTSSQPDAVLMRLRRLAAGEAYELRVVERTDSELVLQGTAGDLQHGDEVRIRVDEHVGIARVLAVEEGLVRLTVLALGVDPTILLHATRRPDAPPSLPGVVGGPPALRLAPETPTSTPTSRSRSSPRKSTPRAVFALTAMPRFSSRSFECASQAS